MEPAISCEDASVIPHMEQDKCGEGACRPQLRNSTKPTFNLLISSTRDIYFSLLPMACRRLSRRVSLTYCDLCKPTDSQLAQ